MELGEPHRVESPSFGSVDQIEPFLKRLSRRRFGAGLELHEHPEIHRYPRVPGLGVVITAV